MTAYPRILALDPSSRGFGFVVMEGPNELLDWGTREARRNKNPTCLKKTQVLLGRWMPSLVILEDCKGRSSRCDRVRRLLISIADSAAKRGIGVLHISNDSVRDTFLPVEAKTKDAIARKIAFYLPELGYCLPPPRKAYMSEDPRMAIFDSAAMALSYYLMSNRYNELSEEEKTACTKPSE